MWVFFEIKCKIEVHSLYFLWYHDVRERKRKKGAENSFQDKTRKSQYIYTEKLKEEPEENYKSEAIRHNIRNSLIHIAGAKLKNRFDTCRNKEEMFAKGDTKLGSELEMR